MQFHRDLAVCPYSPLEGGFLTGKDDFTCVPIIGARTVDQLDDNLGAVDLGLSADQIARIDDAYEA